MMSKIGSNASALLLALVVVAYAACALAGVDVPAALEVVLTALVGSHLYARTPAHARRGAR